MIPNNFSNTKVLWIRTSTSLDTFVGTQWPYANIDCAVTVYADFPPIPVMDEPIDQRFNPRFWAKWFREFLIDLRPKVCQPLCVRLTTYRRNFVNLSRSGPPKIREWKMKNWIQAL